MLHDIGIRISKGTLTNFITTVPEELDYELEQARREGIKKDGYQQIDDTGAKVKNSNFHTFVTCNQYFTYLFTTRFKNRLSSISALLGGIEPHYLINKTSIKLFSKQFSSQKIVQELMKLKGEKLYDKDEFLNLLNKNKIFTTLSSYIRFYLRCFCAIAAFRKYRAGPIGIGLVSDAAGNFSNIYKRHQYCWVHEFRHYKVLLPEIGFYRCIVEKYKRKFKRFYKLMKRYKKNPTSSLREEIEEKFDNIFYKNTDYKDLNILLNKTRKRREGLLVFLDYPHLPLHNNTSEHDIRENVIKRKISGGTKSIRGAYAWDKWLSISHTCRKLGISFYEYLKDRYSLKYEILPLAEFIRLV